MKKRKMPPKTKTPEKDIIPDDWYEHPNDFEDKI